jgi:chemotaxis signal transduction protein/LysM repeat protein
MGDRKLLLFTAGPVKCCTDGISVFRIIDPPEHLVQLPGASSHPLIFKLDNRLVQVVDVLALFGLDRHESGEARSKLIVAEVNGELTGFWVDQVSIMISVAQGQWSPLPSVVPRSLFDAAFRYEDQLILHVDFNRMATASQTAWVYESGLYDVSSEHLSRDEEKPDAVSSEPDTEYLPSDDPAEDTPPPVTQHLQRAKPEPSLKATSQMQAPADRRPAPVKEAEPRHETYKPQVVAHKPQRHETPASLEHSSAHHRHDVEPESYDSVQGAVWGWVLLLAAVGFLGLFFVNFWPESEPRMVTAGQVAPVAVSAETDHTENITGDTQVVAADPSPDRVNEPGSDESVEVVLDPAPAMADEPVVEDDLPVELSSSIQRQGNTVVITLPAEAELIEQESALIEPAPEISEEPREGVSEIAAEPASIASDPDPDPAYDPGKEIRAPTQEVMASETLATTSGAEEIMAEDSLVVPVMPEPVIIEEVSHIVEKGDTLWAIAKRFINDPFRYPELARLSKIKNPDLIYPGDRVLIRIERRPSGHQVGR